MFMEFSILFYVYLLVHMEHFVCACAHDNFFKTFILLPSTPLKKSLKILYNLRNRRSVTICYQKQLMSVIRSCHWHGSMVERQEFAYLTEERPFPARTVKDLPVQTLPMCTNSVHVFCRLLKLYAAWLIVVTAVINVPANYFSDFHYMKQGQCLIIFTKRYSHNYLLYFIFMIVYLVYKKWLIYFIILVGWFISVDNSKPEP